MAATICLLLALVMAGLATTSVPEHPHFRFLPAAVLFFVLSFLVGAIRL